MPRGAKPKEYPPQQVAETRALYALGKTQTEIAAHFGTTQKVVWRLMQRHGVAARPAAKREQRGQSNSYWKGNAASYTAMHKRVVVARGAPMQCEQCGTTESQHYDWANLTGNYADVNDYKRMCRSCHWKFDDKAANFRRKRGMPCSL